MILSLLRIFLLSIFIYLFLRFIFRLTGFLFSRNRAGGRPSDQEPLQNRPSKPVEDYRDVKDASFVDLSHEKSKAEEES